MGPAAILLLFCLGSCAVAAPPAPMTEHQVRRATQYIKDTLKAPMDVNSTKQYAYAALFTRDECKKLSTNENNLKLLRNEMAGGIANALNNDTIIYEGAQMVLATFKRRENKTDKNEHDVHAEYRLLFPSPGSAVSPVQNMINRNRDIGCALFYTLHSPCGRMCANPNHNNSIIPQLSVFNRFSHAFVYSHLYKLNTQEHIWNGLREVNEQMKVFRCFEGNCISCFLPRENATFCLNNGTTST